MNDSAVNAPSLDPAFSGHGPDSGRLGWTSGSDFRGTMDIIWGCALTMFLCCWSILVVNVPRPGTSMFWTLFQKFQLLALCVLAPEILFQVALGQFLSAKHATAAFRAAGYQEWGLRHSFYVNMGAIHLRPPDFKSFPIDAKQLLYLIQHEYVGYPQINEDAIKDKDKIDGMLRFITLVQAMWFVVNLVARAVQGLAIPCIELSTSAWVIFCLGITICWSKKPADVDLVEFIDTATPLAQILLKAGDKAREPYYNTPLDFVSREEWPWSKVWTHGLHYLQAWKLVRISPERPVQHFGDTATPVVAGWWYMLFAFVSIAYFSVFIAAWNFSFPTPTERLLWRIAALCGPICSIAVALLIHFFMMWYPQMKHRWRARMGHGSSIDAEASSANTTSVAVPSVAAEKTQTPTHTVGLTLTSSRQTRGSKAGSQHIVVRVVSRSVDYFRNNSTMKDPQLYTPLRVIFLIWVFGIFYCSSRIYIVVEDFMELRSLPASAYVNVDWTRFWPHF